MIQTDFDKRSGLLFILAFGVVSLFADMVYEGARSVYTLTWPGMVDWLGVGASFIEGHLSPATGKLVELPKAGRS